METKRCFTCKQEFTLDQFLKVPEKDYMLPTDKGTTVECRTCTFKRFMRDGEKLTPYRKKTKLQGELRRFTGIPMNAETAYKYCFEWTYEEIREFIRQELDKKGLEPYNE